MGKEISNSLSTADWLKRKEKRKERKKEEESRDLFKKSSKVERSPVKKT